MCHRVLDVRASAVIHSSSTRAGTIKLVVRDESSCSGSSFGSESVGIGPAVGKNHYDSYYVRRYRRIHDLIKSILQAGLGESGATEFHALDRTVYRRLEARGHGDVDSIGRGETDIRNVVDTLVEIAYEGRDGTRKCGRSTVQVHRARSVQHQRHNERVALRGSANSDVRCVPVAGRLH